MTSSMTSLKLQMAFSHPFMDRFWSNLARTFYDWFQRPWPWPIFKFRSRGDDVIDDVIKNSNGFFSAICGPISIKFGMYILECTMTWMTSTSSAPYRVNCDELSDCVQSRSSFIFLFFHPIFPATLSWRPEGGQMSKCTWTIPRTKLRFDVHFSARPLADATKSTKNPYFDDNGNLASLQNSNALRRQHIPTVS